MSKEHKRPWRLVCLGCPPRRTRQCAIFHSKTINGLLHHLLHRDNNCLGMKRLRIEHWNGTEWEEVGGDE
jgi:hypothetical protein